ncbi:SDR family NAD(P)-dependent oxidoreductase [Rhodovibrionaceae bacterium A322]
MEAAAGIAGLIKTVLSLEAGALPASLHFEEPNPAIAWGSLPVEVVTGLRAWPEKAAGEARVAGVSSFGMSGTNAHVVLTSAPEREEVSRAAPARPVILPLSGASVGGLEGQIAAQVSHLSAAATRGLDALEPDALEPDALKPGALFDRSWSLATGRAALRQRAASVGSDGASLSDFSIRGSAGSGREGCVFLYPGQGSQWAGMGLELAESEPVFQAGLEACADVVGSELLEVLKDAGRLTDTRWTQPAVFAVSWALDRLLASWGVEPVAVLGHSVGDYVAAVRSGALDFERGLGLLDKRAQLMGSLPAGGAMASLRCSAEQAPELLAEGIVISAINGPSAITVSGPEAGIAATLVAAEQKNIHGRRLPVSHAFHSPAMAPAAAELRSFAAASPFGEAELGWISNVTGSWHRGESAADYWAEQLTSPVAFWAGLETLYGAGHRRFLEVGPGTGLAGLVAQLKPKGSTSNGTTNGTTGLTLLKEDQPEALSLARGLAGYWCSGGELDWEAYCNEPGQAGPRRKISLPGYAFDRQRHWLETAASRALQAGGDLSKALYTEELSPLPRSGEAASEVGPLRLLGPGAKALKLPSDEAGQPVYVLPTELSAAQTEKALVELAGLLGAEESVTVLTRGGLLARTFESFCRTAQLEQPEAVRYLDWDGQAADQLAEVLSAARPDLAVLRDGQLYGPELSPARLDLPGQDLKLSETGKYLVTGGAGALGQGLAGRLLAAGAGEVILTGRRAVKEISLSETLKDARVSYRQLDLSKAKAVEAALAELGPLAGVAHLAGSGNFAPAAETTAARVKATFGGKLGGARVLAEALLKQADKPDWVLLYGSISAVWGSKGQAVYGAANGGLKGLAEELKAQGLPALCINWGPWSLEDPAKNPAGGGMTDEGALQLLRGIGVSGLRPAAVGLLENRLLQALQSGKELPASLTVAEVDWDQFAPVYEVQGQRAFLNRVRPTAPLAAVAAGGGSAFQKTLESLPGAARRSKVLALLQEQAQAVMGFDTASGDSLPEDRGLFELGLDSLMAVSLARSLSQTLGQEVPATLIFDKPQLGSLATGLLELLGLSGDSEGPVETSSVASSAGTQTENQPAAVAIVSVACRLPGSVETPEALQAALLAGLDGIREVEADRWSAERFTSEGGSEPGTMATSRGGYLDLQKGLDAGLFGLSPREASRLEPQQRLLLEVSWEALERAGIAADSLWGTKGSVFVGLSNNDFGPLLQAEDGLEGLDLHHATGNALSAAAGRLNHFYGLRGPALALDTACSSSLSAIHLACRSLLSGESDLALAGGVNVILSPAVSVAAARAGMLSPEGRCKTFDGTADGYVRGEGCGLVVLKRLEDAQRDGDPIEAVILGTALNHNGTSGGLTVPSGPAQEALIGEALSAANIQASDIQVLEAHGTGTALGDPIELTAAARALSQGRPEERPLKLGSVKTNLGHLESAAGMAGLTKLVAALQDEVLPGQLPLPTEPNSKIPWADLNVEVLQTPLAWPQQAGKVRLAGLSSFGFTGTNGHLILAGPEVATSVAVQSGTAGEDGTDLSSTGPWPILLSAKSKEALSALARAYADWLTGDEDLAQLSWTTLTGRARLSQRLALQAADLADAKAKLAGISQGQHPVGTVTGEGQATGSVWLFTGQGSQAVGLGLLDAPVYQAVLERCDGALAQLDKELGEASPWQGQSLLEVLKTGTEETLAETHWTQPALYAVGCGLAALWRSWGLAPQAVAGHSLGEYAAAQVAGVFDLEAGLRLVAQRGRLMAGLPTQGTMAAVAAPLETVEEVLASLKEAERPEIGGVNGPQAVTISGTKEAVAAATAALEEAGLRVRPLAVSQAFHSRLLEPMAEDFRQELDAIDFKAPNLAWARGLDGQWQAGAPDPEVWLASLRQPVRFDLICGRLAELGDKVWLELGAKPQLLGLAAESETAPTPAIASLRLPRGDTAYTAQSLSQALTTAALSLTAQSKDPQPDWTQIRPKPKNNKPKSIPTYQYQKSTYWPLKGKAVSGAPNFGRQASTQQISDLLGEALSLPGQQERRFHAWQSPQAPAYLDDHRLYDRVVVPAASHLSMALSAGEALYPDSALQLSNLHFPAALRLADGEQQDVHLRLIPTDEGESLSILSDDGAEGLLHLEGTFEVLPDGTAMNETDLVQLQEKFGCDQPGENPYEDFFAHGYTLGPAFRWIAEVWPGDGSALVRLAPEEAGIARAAYPLHAGLIDSCFQSLCGCYSEGVAKLSTRDEIFIPFALESFTFLQRPKGQVWCQATLRQGSEDDLGLCATDFLLFDEDSGQAFAEIKGFRGRRIAKQVLAGSAAVPAWPEDWVSLPVWQDHSLEPQDAVLSGQNWALWSDLAACGRDAAALLSQAGAKVRELTTLADAESDNLLLLVSEEEPQALLATLGQLARLGHRGRCRVVTQNDGTSALVSGYLASLQQEQPDLQVGQWQLKKLEDLATGMGTGLAEFCAAPEVPLLLRRTETGWQQRSLQSLPAPALTRQDRLALHEALTVREKGLLDSLAYEELPSDEPGLAPHQVELEVAATGLNFRDVLTALGLYPGDPQPLGGEVAGRVLAVGEAVTSLKPGDRVAGFCFGAAGFGSRVIAPADWLVTLPSQLSYERAAALPVTEVTARHALFDLGKLHKGQSILIHAGAGGVGLVAVHLAKAAGAEVIATAGSPEKRAYLESLDLLAVGDSRSLAFVETVQQATKGQGPDLVLDMLSGDLSRASLKLLKKGGVFLELGKRDVPDAAESKELRPDVSYHHFDLVTLSQDNASLVQQHLAEAVQAQSTGSLPAPELTLYAAEDTQSAFRLMAQARHLGKVVVTRPLPLRLYEAGSYLITGGLGGLGLALAERLLREGAGAVVLLGRSAPKPETQARLEEWRAEGHQVMVLSADLADTASLKKALQVFTKSELPPLRGLFHAAGYLQDGLATDQGWAAQSQVLAPKVAGLETLGSLLDLQALDLVALFSSAVSQLGSAGQSAYGAANAWLDQKANSLREQGIPAVALNWGPWQEVGMAARLGEADRARMARRGLAELPLQQGLDILLELAQGAEPQVFVSARPRQAPVQETETAGVEADDALADLTPLALERQVLDRVRLVMGLTGEQRINPRETFKDTGFDSLMAVELRNGLNKTLGQNLPATLIFDYPTPEALVSHLQAALFGQEPLEGQVAPEQGGNEEGAEDRIQEGEDFLARFAEEDSADLSEEEKAALASDLDKKLAAILGENLDEPVEGGE